VRATILAFAAGILLLNCSLGRADFKYTESGQVTGAATGAQVAEATVTNLCEGSVAPNRCARRQLRDHRSEWTPWLTHVLPSGRVPTTSKVKRLPLCDSVQVTL
jgi:hypothetical protein